MRKTWLILALLLALGVLPAFGEIELGFGLTPVPMNDEEDSSGGGDSGFWEDSFKTFHAGWRTAGIFYFSADLLVVPPFAAQGMTSYWDEGSQRWIEGIYRPAIISVYDFGLKLKLWSFSISLQAGLNSFYLYKQDEVEGFKPPEIGANIKLGLGWRFARFIGLEVCAISVQPSFKDAIKVIGDAFSDNELIRDDAIDKLTKQLVPTIQLVIYL